MPRTWRRKRIVGIIAAAGPAYRFFERILREVTGELAKRERFCFAGRLNSSIWLLRCEYGGLGDQKKTAKALKCGRRGGKWLRKSESDLCGIFRHNLNYPTKERLTMHDKIFTAKNIVLFVIGMTLLVVGYILLGQGPVNNPLSKTVAPLVLIAVYCIFVPYAILAKSKKERADEQADKK
jgi:hypothetical protein